MEICSKLSNTRRELFCPHCGLATSIRNVRKQKTIGWETIRFSYHVGFIFEFPTEIGEASNEGIPLIYQYASFHLSSSDCSQIPYLCFAFQKMFPTAKRRPTTSYKRSSRRRKPHREFSRSIFSKILIWKTNCTLRKRWRNATRKSKWRKAIGDSPKNLWKCRNTIG